MKVGILTYFRSRNYGAFLQAVALCSRLNAETDIHAEIIDYNMAKGKNAYSLRPWPPRKLIRLRRYVFDIQLAHAFRRGYARTAELISRESLLSDDLSAFQTFVKNKYDVIIAGSDEIWNVHYFRGFAKPYFLIGDLGCRKFAYAVSARLDFENLSAADHSLLNQALKDFEFISVRDNATYDIVKREGIDEEDLMIACDPSFLFSFDIAKHPISKIVRDRRLNPAKRTIIVMCEDAEVKKRIREALGREYNLVSLANPGHGYINLPDIDPFEWMALIRSADFVISSFFHGVCFSIVNDTPFVAIASSESRRSKLQELLCGTDLEDRYIDLGKRYDVDWHTIVEKHSKEACFRDFVLNQRAGFDRFLERLKNGR